MKKKLLLILLIGTTNLFSQQSDSTLIEFQKRLNQQESDIKNIYSELDKEYRTYRIVRSDLNKTIISKQEEAIDSLNALIGVSNQKLNNINDELHSKIQEANLKTDTQFAQLDYSVEKNKLYWIIATLITLLLGGVFYFLLKNNITSNKSDVEIQIMKTKKSLEEESVKLDSKLVEILESQMRLKNENHQVSATHNSNGKEDHSLALKVADEIIRIQKNLSRMDDNTKGLKQLNSSVQRIQDNFAANGYELVDMLGKEYNEGMKATVNFVQDEDFSDGKRLITRVIKPQVNYKDTMIQTAQIEVTEA
jgi:hypothetical protein